MNDPNTITQLLGKLRSNDLQDRNDAATAIWKAYCGTLLSLACENLDRRLRRRIETDDIVQNTFKSFFLRQQQGQFDLADREDLLRLLMQMTLNKTRSAATREGRHRRNFRREQSVTGGDGDSESDTDWLFDRAKQGAPTPDEAMALAEEAERRLEQLPADLRQIALHKLEGYTNDEIARRQDCSKRRVERKLSVIRELWGVNE